MTLYDVVAHDRKSVDRNVEQTIRKGRSLSGEEYRRKDGSLLEVEASGSIILRHGRETLCVVAHDVTERARAHRLLEERVATLSRIAANLAFDARGGHPERPGRERREREHRRRLRGGTRGQKDETLHCSALTVSPRGTRRDCKPPTAWVPHPRACRPFAPGSPCSSATSADIY